MATVNIREERVEFTAVDKSLTNVTRQGQAAVNQLRSSVDTLKNAVQAVVVGTGAYTFGAAMVREAMQAEQASNRLTAVLKATGHAAGVTKADLDAMADSMHAATQFDDESIRGAQATLLKFGNIYGSVLKEGLKLSADLAAFMGTNIPEAAQLLGKSLQSPTEGLTMMERQFGKLAPAQEKHINDLVRQGRAIEAQNAVLDLWRSKIGGTADLMNTGLTAATTGVNKSWNEMLENFGKTANQAGLVERSLRGLTDVMNDLADASKAANPALAQQQGLANLNDRIEVLTRDLAARRAQRRAYGGADVADDPSFAAAQARIDELRQMAQQRARQVQVLGMAGDPSTFDARDLRLRQSPAVVLGGKATDDEAAKKRALILLNARLLQQDEQFASRFQNAADREAEFLKNLDKVLEVKDDTAEVNARLLQQDEQFAQRFQDAADREAEFADPAKLEAMLESLHEVNDVGRELGLTFTSAFEDAVVEGKKFSDVLKGIEKDLARIIIRKTLTEPVSDWFAGINWGAVFSSAGGSAAGAPVVSGPGYASGTDYVPRTGWAMLHEGERVVPAAENRNGGGGVSIVQNISVAAGATRAEVMMAMTLAKNQAKAEIEDSLNRGSRRYTPR